MSSSILLLEKMEETNEPSITEAVKSLLFNEDLYDVTLRANDGMEVKGNRCILAARSPVFRRMLFGRFSEANQPIVDVGGVEGNILRIVVEYIYTNKVRSMLDKFLENNNSNNNGDDNDEYHAYCRETASSLIPLVGGATYFALPGMNQQIEKDAERVMARSSQLSLCIWEACRRAAAGTSSCGGCESLGELALGMIRSDPLKSLTNDTTLASMDVSTLEAILKDNKMNASELDLFRVLEKWAKIMDDNVDDDNDEEDDSTAQQQQCGKKRKKRPQEQELEQQDYDGDDNRKCTQRKKAAKKLTRHIRFELISPNELPKIVASSGLVSQDQLLKAYQKQAQRAEELQHNNNSGVNSNGNTNSNNIVDYYKAPRYCGMPRWDQTNYSDIYSAPYEFRRGTICHSGIRTGEIHTWTIRILELASSATISGPPKIFLGIKSIKAGQPPCFWSLSNRGTLWHNLKLVGSTTTGTPESGSSSGEPRTFDKGDQITFRLDLSNNNNNNNNSARRSSGRDSGNDDNDAAGTLLGGGGGGNGVLSASINGGPFFGLFKNLNAILSLRYLFDPIRVVPVVELHPGTSIRLLRIQQEEE